MKTAVVFALLTLAGCAHHGEPSVRHLNPEAMHANAAFSQGVVVQGPHRTVYVGGQNCVDEHGELVGKGDLAAQCAQVARNVKAVLAAAGAGPENVIQWTVHVVQGQDLRAGMQAFAAEFGELPAPPTLSVIVVPGLAHPAFLVEVSAVAVVPLES